MIQIKMFYLKKFYILGGDFVDERSQSVACPNQENRRKSGDDRFRQGSTGTKLL